MSGSFSQLATHPAATQTSRPGACWRRKGRRGDQGLAANSLAAEDGPALASKAGRGLRRTLDLLRRDKPCFGMLAQVSSPIGSSVQRSHRQLKDVSTQPAMFPMLAIPPPGNIGRNNRDLEEENAQLRRHVAQAEESIAHYKSFLSSRAPTSLTANGDLTWTPAFAPILARAKDTSSQTEEVADDAPESQAALATARQRIVHLERQLVQQKLSATSAHLSVERPAPAPAPASNLPSNLRETQMQLQITSQQADLSRLSSRLRKMSEKSAVDQAAMQRHAQTAKRLFSALRVQLAKDRAHAASLLSQSKATTEGTIRLVTDKFLSALHSQSQKTAQLQSMIEAERLHSSFLSASLAAKSKTADEDNSDLTAQVQALRQRLADARLLAVAVLSSHEDELKAAEKQAHVRDLSRVAQLRELEVANDGLASDLKFARDLLQVLGFCCGSAESALADLSAETASKLSRSRARRTEAIEASIAQRRSELDQRSQAVLTLGGKQLAKAAAKAANIVKEKRDATTELAARLGVVLASDPHE